MSEKLAAARSYIPDAPFSAVGKYLTQVHAVAATEVWHLRHDPTNFSRVLQHHTRNECLTLCGDNPANGHERGRVTRNLQESDETKEADGCRLRKEKFKDERHDGEEIDDHPNLENQLLVLAAPPPEGFISPMMWGGSRIT